MFRSIPLIGLFLLASALFGQGLMERKHPEIFPTDGKMRRGGFYFAPGITWTLTRFKDKEEDVFRTADSSYTALFSPKGAIGWYVEAGWFLSTRDPIIIDYWDVGLAYKQLKGTEEMTGTLARGDSSGAVAASGAFNDQHVAAHLNANKLFQTRDYQFIQVSLGANVDYHFAEERTYSSDIGLLNRQLFPPQWIAQAHFKVGYGFKLTQQLMIIPAIETPIFSVTPDDDGNFGKLQWFSSKYRPLILSVRFLFLRYPKGFACVPVKNNAFEKQKVLNPSYERK